MRPAFKFLAVLALAVVPALAHADVITNYSINGLLAEFGGQLNYPGPDSYGLVDGYVSGTFSYDVTTGAFTAVDLTYTDTSTNVTDNFGSVGPTFHSYNGNAFDYTILGDTTGDPNAFSNDEAYLQLSDGHLCTLVQPCPGGNASNFISDGDVPNIFFATIDTNTTGLTPEPSSLALLGTGILGLAGATRRKFRKA